MVESKRTHAKADLADRTSESAQWLAENRAALEGYGRYLEARGVLSEGLRRF